MICGRRSGLIIGSMIPSETCTSGPLGCQHNFTNRVNCTRRTGEKPSHLGASTILPVIRIFIAAFQCKTGFRGDVRYRPEHQLGLLEIRAVFQGRPPVALRRVSVSGTVILYLESNRPPLTSMRFPFPKSTFDRSSFLTQLCWQLSAITMNRRLTFTEAHCLSNACTTWGRSVVRGLP
jgi:hypothetical protein